MVEWLETTESVVIIVTTIITTTLSVAGLKLFRKRSKEKHFKENCTIDNMTVKECSFLFSQLEKLTSIQKECLKKYMKNDDLLEFTSKDLFIIPLVDSGILIFNSRFKSKLTGVLVMSYKINPEVRDCLRKNPKLLE